MRLHAKFVFLLGIILVLGASRALSAGTYTTHFTSTENPISEGGKWINGKTNGLDWHDVKTLNGIGQGASTGSLHFDDPTAVLTGSWGPDQTVTATVWVTNRQAANFFGEVEIRLRSAITAHSCTGYEVNFSAKNSSEAYVQIIRWNGPLGGFDYLTAETGSPCIVNTGDVVKATIVGNVITAYINGTQICQAVDDTYSSGNPGFGFYYEGSVGSISDFGFTTFTASDGLNVPSLNVAWNILDGSFHLSGIGVPNLAYKLEFTPQLTTPSWQTLGMVTADNFGGFSYIDHPPVGVVSRFYRVGL